MIAKALGIDEQSECRRGLRTLAKVGIRVKFSDHEVLSLLPTGVYGG